MKGETVTHETKPERILSSATIPVDAGEVVIPNAGVPTQLSSPRQATKRTAATVVAGILVALAVINPALLIVQEELQRTGLELPAWFWIGLNASVVLVGAVSTIVQRVILIPQVNAWIVAHFPGFSPEPVVKGE